MTFPMTGKAPKGYRAYSTVAPWQEPLLQGQAQGFGGIQGSIIDYLQQLLSSDPEAMQAFEAPYMRQFNEQIVPGIAERFAGQGALSSSGLQQSLGQAGAGLQEKLAMMREGLRGDAAQTGMRGISDLLNMNTQAWMQKPQKQRSFWEQMALEFGGGVGKGIGMLPMLI